MNSQEMKKNEYDLENQKLIKIDNLNQIFKEMSLVTNIVICSEEQKLNGYHQKTHDKECLDKFSNFLGEKYGENEIKELAKPFNKDRSILKVKT